MNCFPDRDPAETEPSWRMRYQSWYADKRDEWAARKSLAEMQEEEGRFYRDYEDQRCWLEILYLGNVQTVEDEKAKWEAEFLAHLEEQKLSKIKERAEAEMKREKRKGKEEQELQDKMAKWRELEEMPPEKKMKMTPEERQERGLRSGQEMCEEDLIKLEKIREAVMDRWLFDMIE